MSKFGKALTLTTLCFARTGEVEGSEASHNEKEKFHCKNKEVQETREAQKRRRKM